MRQDDHDDVTERTAEPPREPVFNLAPVVVAIAMACIAIHVLIAHVLSTAAYVWVIENFAFIPVRYSGAFPFTAAWLVSPLSYSLLHGGYAHLIINMIWLAAFGSPLANRIGAGRFLLFWAATALGAVALHYLLHSGEAIPLVGASGAISGMMGAAARFAFRIDRRMEKPAFAGEVLSISRVLSSRPAVTFLLVWFAINLATGVGFASPGVSAQIAWEAHIGGFVVGFFAVRIFDPGAAGPARAA